MKRILVVDDEPKIVHLIRAYLEKSGFRALPAYDGRGALDLFRAEQPDLVVLDLMLPDIDGMDVARAIRKESDIPIIMLTARVEEAADRCALTRKALGGFSRSHFSRTCRLLRFDSSADESRVRCLQQESRPEPRPGARLFLCRVLRAHRKLDGG